MKTKNKIPMRQCTGCREMKSKKEMLRVLKTTEDEIVLDATGKKNGRGAYLCFSRECLDKAIKNHGLERSLKTAVPYEVYERLKKELEDIEKEQSTVADRAGNQSRQDCKRRIFHREICQNRKRTACNRG